MILFTLEYRKTPPSTTPVPIMEEFNYQGINGSSGTKRVFDDLPSHEKELPRALMGETGVLKKSTEVTMTTTLFTQLPTEWVTGDTLANIM